MLHADGAYACTAAVRSERSQVGEDRICSITTLCRTETARTRPPPSILSAGWDARVMSDD